MNDIEDLKRHGNLLELLLNQEHIIYLLRVYGYGSNVGDILYEGREDYIPKNVEEKKLIDVLHKIREEANKQYWNDNKIVCEIKVSCWRIFISYWDCFLTIGASVIPNDYMPKCLTTNYGTIKKIPIL